MTRNVTVAATQMACSWDRPRTSPAPRTGAPGRRQGCADHPDPGTVRDPLFCQKPNPDYLQLATTVEENAAIAHFQALARVAGGIADQLLRTRRAPASTASRSSTPMAATSGSTARATSRTARLPREVLLQSGRHRLQVWQTRYARIGVGICWDQWFPNRRAAWPCSARNSCSTRPPSVANRTTPASARAITGSACSKAMPEPT